MPRYRVGLVVAAVTLALAACSSGDHPIGPRATDPLVQRIIAMGFRPDMIVDHGTYFLVEGDIRFDKVDLTGSRAPAGRDTNRIHKQWATNNLVSGVGQITVDLTGLAANPAWQTAVRGAMQNWNALPGAAIAFSEASPGEITFSYSSCGGMPGVVACSSFPTNVGKPGPTVGVSRNFDFFTAGQKLFNMTHELGHTIGFRHTNWQALGESSGPDGANLIAGTPQTDANSIMNGATGSNSWIGFSAFDTTAAIALYPLPATVTVSNSGGHVDLAFSSKGGLSYAVEWVRFIHARRDFQHPYVNTADSVAEGTTTASSFLSKDVFTGFSICDISNLNGADTRWTDDYHVTAFYAGGRHNTATVEGQNIPLAIVNGMFQGGCGN